MVPAVEKVTVLSIIRLVHKYDIHVDFLLALENSKMRYMTVLK